MENELFLIIILILTIIMTVAIYMIKTPDEVEKDIIFRNGYRVLKDSYLIPEISDVYEDGSQDRQRNRFEKNWVILDPIVDGEKKLDRNILTGHHGIMAC